MAGYPSERVYPWLYPLYTATTHPEVAAACCRIHGRMNGHGLVRVHLDRPAGGVTGHQVEGNDLATSTGTHKPKPLGPLGTPDEDQFSIA